MTSSIPGAGDPPGGIRHSPRRCSRHTLATYERQHPRRAHIERFVQSAFAQKHGASIRSFMPTLYALQGRDALQGREDRICGVAGVRSAAAERLFLECYLPQPIEVVLADRTGAPVLREQIVEVGNLASLSCRAAFHLVVLLPRLLLDRGHLWVTFTATNLVRSILDHFQAPVIELGGASVDKVVGFGDDWGRYYESDPRVMAARLPDGLALQLAQTGR